MLSHIFYMLPADKIIMKGGESMIAKNRKYILGAVVLAVLCMTSCAENRQTDAQTDVNAASDTETVQERPEEVAEPEEPESQPVEEPEEKKEIPDAPPEEPAMYTEGFSVIKNYADYGESGSAIKGESIWVEGYTDSYDEERHSLVLINDDGEWAVSVGESGTDSYYELVKEAVGQHVRVFGKYTGYSSELAMPTMAFIPAEYQLEPYRLETVDSSFRLTQLDYAFEKPEFDTERTYGRLTYMEPSSWEPTCTEDTLFYYIFDGIPAIMMGHFEKVKDTGFDELGSEAILMDLAESYVNEGDSIIRKQSFKFHGYPALCFETTWTRDDLPMPMSMFCYMFIVDDEYYFYGSQEPFLVGESVKRILPELLSDVKVEDVSAEKTEEKKAEDKKTEDKKTEDKKAEETKPAAAKTEEKKPTVPTKAEILGKVFTQSITADFVGKENNETFSDSTDLPDTLFTADLLAGYDESTGKVTLHDNSNEMIMTMNLTFSYDGSGNVVYSGPLAIDAAEYIASGTVSGHMK